MQTPQSIRTGSALSNEQIARVAPSVFATEPWEGVSDKYAFISTATVLERMRNEGLFPVAASQSIVRIPGKRAFAKHQLRFRREQDINIRPRVVNGDAHYFYERHGEAAPVIPEIALTNAHDRTSSYVLDAGLFRLLCSNGLMVSCANFESIRTHHVGNISDEVIEGTFRIIDEFPAVVDIIDDWSKINTTKPQQIAFARAAATLRWDDRAPVEPQQLLLPRREADAGDDVWRVFNRVQENLVKGGVSGHTRTQRARRLRTQPVNSVTEDTRLNKALWQLATSFATELKAA